jgi:hypothetical protein
MDGKQTWQRRCLTIQRERERVPLPRSCTFHPTFVSATVNSVTYRT